MKGRKKIMLIAGAALTAVVLALTLYLLYRTWLRFHKAEAALQASNTELHRLFAKKPFPSQDNIDQEKRNLETLRKDLAALQTLMRKGEIEPVDQSPSAFNAKFWSVRDYLQAQARERGVTVAENYSFGFQRHMAGYLPDYQDVPRLTQQLIMVQDLCRLLYEARITELKRVVRDEFEGGAVAATGGGASAGAGGPANPTVKETGVIPEGSLFGKMHFVLQFSAHGNVLREVLNQLAKNKMVVVVTRLDVTGEDWRVALPKPEAEAKSKNEASPKPIARLLGRRASATPVPVVAPVPEKPAAPLPRDQRIVSGRDVLLNVTLELDIYNFRPVEDGKQS